MKHIIVITAIVLVIIVQASQLGDEEIKKQQDAWEEWLAKNKDKNRYKFKDYKPKIKSLKDDAQEIDGIEAMKFIQMYRKNQKGDIGEKIDLFKEFFMRKDILERKHFERMAAVWLKRHQYEALTGQKYFEQEHIVKTYKRQNARKFANDELRTLPIEQLKEEFDEIWPSSKTEFTIYEAAHWLVDGHLYAKIGSKKLGQIFEEHIRINFRPSIEEPLEIPPTSQFLDEEQEINNEEILDSDVDKIDL